MTDIYGMNQRYVPMDFTSSDLMVLQVGNKNMPTEYLVQQVNFQYMQPLRPLYEIGSENVYYGPGRPGGTLQVSRIIGMKDISELFGATGTGPWSTRLSKGTAADRTLVFRKKPVTLGNLGSPIMFIMLGCVIENYGGGTDSNGMLFQETASLRFCSLVFGSAGLAAVGLTAALATAATGLTTTALGTAAAVGAVI